MGRGLGRGCDNLANGDQEGQIRTLKEELGRGGSWLRLPRSGEGRVGVLLRVRVRVACELRTLAIVNGLGKKQMKNIV